MYWLELDRVNQNYVTVATWGIGLLFAFALARYALIPHLATNREKRILDTRDWDDIMKGLNPDWAHRYYWAIAASTGWFDRFYGARLLGWQAFDRALSFAFFYAVSTLLIGWAIFDAGVLGGIEFLPIGHPLWIRISTLIVLVMAVLFFFGSYYYLKRISFQKRQRIMSYYFKKIEDIDDSRSRINYFFILSTVGVVVALAAGTSTHYLSRIDLVILSTALLVAVPVAASVAVGFSSLTAITVSLILISFIFLYFSIYQSSIFPFFYFRPSNIQGKELNSLAVITLFWIVLPILNALADFVSVAATRQFLRGIQTRNAAIGRVLVGVAIDIAIAISCLALLLALATQTLDLWAAYSPIPLTFDWRAYRDTLCAGNWQQGTMLWLMLMTTLLPTALHLGLGVGAMLSHSAHIDAQISAIMSPAYERLKASRGVEKGDGKLASKLLTAAQVQSLVELLGKKEGLARIWTAVLFVCFMALLIWGTVVLGQIAAMPWLCPPP